MSPMQITRAIEKDTVVCASARRHWNCDILHSAPDVCRLCKSLFAQMPTSLTKVGPAQFKKISLDASKALYEVDSTCIWQHSFDNMLERSTMIL